MDPADEQHLDHHNSDSTSQKLEHPEPAANPSEIDTTDLAHSVTRITRAKQRQLEAPSQLQSRPEFRTTESRNSPAPTPRRSARISVAGPGGDIDQVGQSSSGKGKKKVEIDEGETSAGKRK